MSTRPGKGPQSLPTCHGSRGGKPGSVEKPLARRVPMTWDSGTPASEGALAGGGAGGGSSEAPVPRYYQRHKLLFSVSGRHLALGRKF